MKKIHNIRELKRRRQELRRNGTFYEKKLWEVLRNRNLGVKFRRQHSIGYYIVDFYCAAAKLIIEIDGGVHDEAESKIYDNQRTLFFEEQGYMVLRFKNIDIKNEFEKVIEVIQNSL